MLVQPWVGEIHESPLHDAGKNNCRKGEDMKTYWPLFLALTLSLTGLALIAKPSYHHFKRQYAYFTSIQDWSSWKEKKQTSQEGDPIAWLTAPTAQLSTLVLLGATETNLHLWPSLSRIGFLPEEAGLKVIQAHRDLHFGNLAKLQVGSAIELETIAGKKHYIVSEVEILDPDTVVRRLMESRHENRLVLLTCYPFRYIGPAPQRYLVWAQEG